MTLDEIKILEENTFLADTENEEEIIFYENDQIVGSLTPVVEKEETEEYTAMKSPEVLDEENNIVYWSENQLNLFF